MKTLMQTIRRRTSKLGNEGSIGIGLFILCLIFYFVALRPTLEQLDRMQHHVETLKETVKNSVDAKSLRAQGPAAQLAAFYNFFPPQKSTPEWLEKIYQAADDEHIQLTEGDYRASNRKGEKVIHYQITLPVKGSYLQLRKFLATVLSQIPNASLDQISYERQKIGESVVDANIKLTLYLGE